VQIDGWIGKLSGRQLKWKNSSSFHSIKHWQSHSTCDGITSNRCNWRVEGWRLSVSTHDATSPTTAAGDPERRRHLTATTADLDWQPTLCAAVMDSAA